ncbi:MAG: ATP-binding cassette domain-containing protein [Christensenellaceae bacterium]
MEILPGQKIAFIGGTGSGKSTVVRLLLGLASPTGGELSFDGIPAETLGERRLRENISCVLQRDTIFSGTIRENVLAGREVEDTKVLRVSDAAHDFVEAQKGVGLSDDPAAKPSGGQKQRLAWRALLKPAAINIRRQFFRARFSHGIQASRLLGGALEGQDADYRYAACDDGDELR